MMKLPKILRPKRSGSDEFAQLSPRSPKSPLASPKSPKRRSGFALLSPKSSRSNILSNRFTSAATSASSSVSSSINAELEAVFRLFDSNGDGRICRAELAAILTCLGESPTDEELDKMVSEVDSDGDGFISLDEFIRFNTGCSSASNAELRAVFHVFDIDRNGFISADELHRVLVGLGDTSLTMEDCGRMIRGVDCNGDGRVDFEEFKLMMASA